MKKLFLTLITLISISSSAQIGKLDKNGFYVEGIFGTATTDIQDAAFGGGLKLGNIWYFGNSGIWHPGLKTVWFRGTTYFNDSDILIQGSVTNVGFANLFKFNESIGLETNINVGYNIVYNKAEYYNNNKYYYDGYNFYNYDNYDYNEVVGGGVMINPEIKFRYKVLAVGLDMVFSNIKDYDDNYNMPMSTINLSVGAKF